MPLPPVAVEIAPAPQQTDLVQALLDACSRAVSPVTCVPAEEVEAVNVSALAIVVWHADGVRIQVGARPRQQKGDWVNRRVNFVDTDEDHDRWTAAGFVVGTLASRFVEQPPPEAEPELPPEPPPLPPPLATTPATPVEPLEPPPRSVDRELWLEASGIAGPLFDRGPWRTGGMLGLAYLPEAWPVFGYSSLRMSWRPKDSENLQALLGEADLGLGVHTAPAAAWTLDASAAVVAELIRVTLEEPGANQDLHLAPALRARLALAWRFSERFSLGGGVGFSWWTHKTQYFRSVTTQTGTQREILVQQQAVTGEVSLGLRVHWR